LTKKSRRSEEVRGDRILMFHMRQHLLYAENSHRTICIYADWLY